MNDKENEIAVDAMNTDTFKFNTYITQLEHRENAFTANLVLPGDNSGSCVTADFKRISEDLFIANFKADIELKFLEKLTFKSKPLELSVLLPVLSKYNKRKLTKLTQLLTVAENQKEKMLLYLLTIEKFLRVEDLLPFFDLERDQIAEFLIQKEIEKQIKIINFTTLTITSIENLQRYYQQLDAIFTQCYTNRVKTIKQVDIAQKLKLPHDSLFFQYLLRRFAASFSFKLQRDKVVFQKVSLSENEKGSLEEIENVLKQNKTSIFSIQNIMKYTGLLYKDVNNSLWFLIENGQVIQLNKEYFIFKEDLNKILNKLKKYKRNQGEMIDIQAFRELTNLSRRYIITMLEYFDSQQVTQRIENKRKILLGV